jgi:cell division septation protein DedD
MKILRILALLALCVALTVACSQKKEDAAKLEEEMLAQEQADTMGDSLQKPEQFEDTTAVAADVAAIPTEEVSVAAMPSRPAGEGYTVQVAACESSDYARHLVDLYTQRGYEPFVSEFSIEGQTYYRVRIGLFDLQSEAKQLKAELADKYTIQPWIDLIAL